MCLSKAAAHHEYNPGWKIVNRETFNQCGGCGKDVNKKYDTTIDSGDSCCKFYYEKACKSGNDLLSVAQRPSMRALLRQGVVKKGKTKVSESPDKIKGLIIREEMFGTPAAASMCALPWNFTCDCVRKDSNGISQGSEQAVKKKSNSQANPLREFWTCMKGDRGCKFFLWDDELARSDEPTSGMVM